MCQRYFNVTAFLLCLFFSKAICQCEENRINFVLIIDEPDLSITHGFSNSYILLPSQDTILVSYYPGELLVSSDAYKRVFALPINTEVMFYTKYTVINRKLKQFEHEYKIKLKIGWLQQGYIVLKVYNFANKKNWKYFYERKGYGVDIETPSFTRLLARKKFRKVKNGY